MSEYGINHDLSEFIQVMHEIKQTMDLIDKRVTHLREEVSKRDIVWYGRWDIGVRSPGRELFTTVKIPAEYTPWDWPKMPWYPIKVWLPHPPVRGRANK